MKLVESLTRDREETLPVKSLSSLTLLSESLGWSLYFYRHRMRLSSGGLNEAKQTEKSEDKKQNGQVFVRKKERRVGMHSYYDVSCLSCRPMAISTDR